MQQVIWITGASSGIGEAVAVNYARRGQVQLILSSRRVSELARVKQRCVEMGLDASDVFVLPLDVVAVDEHAEKVATALQAFGQVDLLLNNAGISQRSWCVDTDLSVYRQLFEVDVIGQISLAFADAAVVLSGSSHALRTRTSSTGSWLILRARNTTPPLCHTWRHQPERHLRHCLFSQEANLKSQYSISKDAREPRGRECCACSFRNGRIGIARSSQPTTFQGNTRVLRELLPFSRQYQ